MKRLAPGRGDDGAYAILYAALVVVLIGMGSLVVDIASVRQDRRIDRSAADAAALGGVEFLSTSRGPADPFAACNRAWDYLTTTLRLTGVPSSKCDNFQGLTCAMTPTEVDQDVTLGKRTIRIAWPIPSTGGTGFLNPELAPGKVAQPYSAGDGSLGGCDRLGVAVFQQETFGLAGALGASGTETQVHSVALVAADPALRDLYYPLAVLDKFACVALAVNGTGTYVKVVNNGSTPGRIGIDSNGTQDCSGGPNVANGVILDAGGGSSLESFDGLPANPDGSTDGAIEVFGPAALPANTAVSTKVHTCATVPCIWRAPKVRSLRITRQPFDEVYNCNVGCTGGSPEKAYIDRVRVAAGAVTATTSDWTVIKNSTRPGCRDSGAVLTASTTGSTQYFIDCGRGPDNTWTVNGDWVFPAGSTVIVDGTLNVAGCFAMNGPPTLCASPYAPPEPSGATSQGLLSVRGDIKATGADARLVLPRTFVHQPDLAKRLEGSGFLVISWTAPYGDKAALAATCAAPPIVVASIPPPECFRNLAFWTDAAAPDTRPQVIKGGGELRLEGTFFAGESKLTLAGGSLVDVLSSQFIVKRLEASGGSTLTFKPDPSRTNGVPPFKKALIR